jgi:hypothetical protein
MRLPDFIAAGPGRTGTTWLHRVLEGHVDLPYGVKETRFFSTHFDQRIERYARHFRYATGERRVAEICPPYFFEPDARARIKTYIPDCKIITTMRDPASRAYSMYKLWRHIGAIRHGTLEENLDALPSLARGNHYAFHLKGWFDTFGRENVLVTMYEELRAEPQKYLNRVTDFAGVERIALSDTPQIGDQVHAFSRAPKNPRLARKASRLRFWLEGRRAYRLANAMERAGVWDFCQGRGEPFPPLTPEQDASMRKRYLPEIEALEDLLQIDLSAWKNPRASETSLRLAERQTG